MQIVTSTGGIAVSVRPEQGIKDLRNSGFENVMLELGRFCQIENLWPDGKKKIPVYALRNPEIIRKAYQSLLQICGEVGMKLPVGSLPSLSPATKRTDLNDKVWQLGVMGVRACEEAGCRYVIAPSLFAGLEREEEWAVSREFYLELAAACGKEQTRILLKNECRNIDGHLIRGNCAQAEEACAWIEELNTEVGMERFGFCLDTGICNICGQDMHELTATLGKHLKAVILRDNNGQINSSYLPFTATGDGFSSDWLGLIRGLREVEFDGSLIIHFGSTAGAFPPLLKPGILTLAKSVADYFAWQIQLENAMKRYDSIVLFGAGNMCRNYMKNYGEKYPPLFTCDNSRERWGEEFCGLEIKPPEALRELPEGCGVFICNIYYREIEKQLRDMGVENIEYFNDEYMPSYHMDRLEMR